MEKNISDNKEWEVSSRKLLKSHGYADGDGNAKRVLDNARLTQDLARDILRLSHHTLFINLRFMEAAFIKIVPDHDMDTLSMATDGRFLYYNAAHICRLYQKEKGLPARDYLHTVLHCVFRHLFISKKIDGPVWDLACDIAVENLINKMNLKSLSCERETAQAWLIRDLAGKLPRLSAEWIYKYFMEENISDVEIEQLRRNFMADDHSIWYNKTILEDENQDKEENAAGDEDDDSSGKKIDDNEGIGEDLPPDGEEGEDAGQSDEVLSVVESEEGGGIGGEGEGNSDREDRKPALKPAELRDRWKEIAERIQVDLDTFSDAYGEGAGDMQQLLAEINREKYDYANFLKRFSVIGENVEINDDEFDYIFYTYGLKLYKDMPLVEPLEYKDVKKIREFVIAIDTSESVSGDLVQAFVSKTWNILKQSENFFRKINVHIIQCGARVEEDVRISSQEEFDAYISDMVLKGFGGTDFRPVFERVDQLIRQHEFINLKGMIYFTDGYGSFPHNAPAYETAFVFLDQGYDLPDLPPWAIKVVMTEDELKLL
ncbi:MAG: metallopeptidase [Eubacterium sp.]|nr:metallopeptidase [Eubacterium sp.]